ncbi:MAG: PQQ-binding-like beta-propeller repeat protein, partial [Gemmataceae bacterium]
MKTKLQRAGSVLLLSILAAGLVSSLDGRAQAPEDKARHDWPQWRGPNHDNVSTETGLLKNWPKSGPKLLWTSTEAGLGYSGPAIVGDRLYTLGSDKTNDFAIAIDTRNGKKVWSTKIAPFAQNGWGGGPRGTPTVDGAFVYALSASGVLACLQATGGKRTWSVNLDGKKPNWNYSESPLVEGDQVVCSPGGNRGTLMAFNKSTGDVLWRSKELTDPAGYSSIVPTTVGGVHQYVQLTMKGVAGVAAKDGRLLWYYPNKKYRTAVIPSPIVHEDYVYAVAGYGAGAVLLKLTPSGDGTKAEQLYDADAMRLMNNKHEGVVRVGDYVYGWSDGGGWTCQEWKSGKKMWQSKKLKRGSLTCADGMLYCYSEDKGTVVLVPASPNGWDEKGRFTIPQHSDQRSRRGGVWTHP